MNEAKKQGTFGIQSIRTRIVAMAVACIVAALVIAYISMIPDAERTVTDVTENNMLDLAKSYTQILNNKINAVNDTTSYMGSNSDFYSCLVQGGEGSLLQAELKQYLRDNPSYTQVDVYDKSGTLVTTTGEAGADMPYYVNAVLSTENAAQSDLVTDASGAPSVVCAVPLLNAGSMFGVVCVTVPVDVLTADFAKVQLRGIESSFAYLLSAQGYFLYHPEPEVIGKITGNKTLRQFLEQANVASAIVNFRYNGSNKVVGVATSELNSWMLVIQADKSELLQPINNMMVKSLLILIIALAVLAAIVYIMSVSITRPIQSLTKGMLKIAQFDFREDSRADNLAKRKDEIGAMSRAVQLMQSNIREIVEKLSDVCQNIGSGSATLNDVATSLNDCASDNSAVSEELAAGMEETSGMVDSISSQVEHIRSQTQQINRQSQSTVSLSKDIMHRADDAKEATAQAAKNTKMLYKEVNREAKEALERSKAVSRINSLTENIMNIADQTSLLALNASIEAARSGEHGKGFAVVANEIGNLADQSAETVSGIMDIVGDVTNAVGNMNECLQKTLTFLETSVMKDYDNFMKVSGAYNQDAASFSDTIQRICSNLDELGNATGQIAEAITSINQTVSDSSNGITGIAERATEVVTLSGTTYERVQENANMAEALQQIVDKFKI